MAIISISDHDEIRDWAAARAGFPAIVDVSTEGGTQPMLRIVFGQHAYQDQDQAERPQNAGGVELVEWSDWFEILDQKNLALSVSDDFEARDSSYELVSAGSSAGMDDLDIKFLAENTDLSPNQTKELIERHGRDRDKLLEMAKTMKAES